MTREEVKKKLQGYREAQRRMEIAERELEVFESKLTPKIDYAKPRVGGNQVTDMAGMIAELSALHERIHAEYMEASRELIEVKKMVDTVEDVKEKAILSRRYIQCQHWDTISYEMRLDRRWVFRLHDRALDELADGTVKTDKKANAILGKEVELNN